VLVLRFFKLPNLRPDHGLSERINREFGRAQKKPDGELIITARESGNIEMR